MTGLRQIGEFGLIELIRQLEEEASYRLEMARLGGRAPQGRLRAAGLSGAVMGIGDDAAVLPGRPGFHTLLTVDTLVEGVHFLRPKISPADLGARALAVNVSDIAAMGGYPTFAVVSLAIPESLEVEWLEELYRGLLAEGTTWGVQVVGGDTVRAGEFSLTVALLGEVEEGRAVLRRGARPGERIAVTGTLGDSAAGLELLLRESGAPALDPEVRARLLARHFTPRPRVPEGRDLGAGIATAMIDVSDGIATDLRHLCSESGVGARIYADRLPLSPDLRAAAAALGLDPVSLALSGGEDYELLFTAPEEKLRPTLAGGTPVTVIGEVVEADRGLSLVREDGRSTPLPHGYRHF
ncbi:MAG: thiamine-phosphate kinase [Bacillota bacterium]|nr:thiamine-phosphate kinase [Bacillota bacterium]